jgi:ComF family protein
MFKRFVRGMLDLLAPPRCAACDMPLLVHEQGFCGGCCTLIDGAPEETPTDLVACVYGGPLAEALHRLKYGAALHVAPALASLLEPAVESLMGRVDMVTAVPLAPARLRSRGYNQSGLLAQAVARGLGVPFRPRALQRVRAGARQVGQGREVRAVQLHGAFAAARVRGLRVLVVDDVRTTGATFAEARRALHQAEAQSVLTLALAQTPETEGPHV